MNFRAPTDRKLERSLSRTCGRGICDALIAFCIAFAIVACALLALGGCAAFEARTQRITLSESGFLARVPETEGQRESYVGLPPYRLYRGVKDGRTFYAYKDEKAGVVYIGNEQDYELYMGKVRRLVAFYETTETKMVAHNMDSDLQARWDRSWTGASIPGN
jgi:hypothetical protein